MAAFDQFARSSPHRVVGLPIWVDGVAGSIGAYEAPGDRRGGWSVEFPGGRRELLGSIRPEQLAEPAEAPIPLESERGQALLEECCQADRAAFDALWQHFRVQEAMTTCGVASAAHLLRAAPAAESADGFARDERGVLQAAGEAVSGEKLAVSGLTLPELGGMLAALGLEAEVRHAEGPVAGAAGEREALLRALRAAPNQLVILNYHMSTAGQVPFGGHFSPLAAYNASARRLLVLDVWPYTGPCWCTEDRIWAAMGAEDSESGKPRGWIAVRFGFGSAV